MSINLKFLPANRAYAFTLGDSIVDMRGRYLFTRRPDAVDAAASCGLAVDARGKVTTAPASVPAYIAP
jgi:hypothetical protein